MMNLGFAIAIGTLLVACGGNANNPSGTLTNGDASTQDCSSLPKAPYLAGCMQPVGGWPSNDITAVISESVSGTVSSVSPGPVSGGCLGTLPTDSGSELVVLTVHTIDAGVATDYDVEYAAPVGNTLWHVGDTIFVSYARSGGGWGPADVDLTLSHGQAVDVYVGHAGAVSNISEAPLKWVQGPARCTQNDTCGSWSAYDLEVVDTGGNVKVPYGSTIDVPGYHVINGGVRQQLSTNTQCMDWYVADVSVAVIASR